MALGLSLARLSLTSSLSSSGAVALPPVEFTGFDFFDDFDAYANQTFLVPGGPTPALDWQAWTGTGATTNEKYNAVVRTGGDLYERSSGVIFDSTAPGKYLIGRELGSVDQHVTWVANELNTNRGISVGAIDNTNRMSIMAFSTIAARRFINSTQTNFNTTTYAGDTRYGGGQTMTAGTRMDVQVWNGKCYIWLKGLPRNASSPVDMSTLAGTRFGFATHNTSFRGADNVGAAALTYRLTMASLKTAYPRIQGLGGYEHGARDIPVSGTWECRTNTPPTGLHWRLIDYEFGDTDGYVWKDWDWVNSPTINNDGVLTGGVYVGTWSATIRVPCGLAGTRPYILQVRPKEDSFAIASSDYFFVAYTLLCTGQSNMAFIVSANSGAVLDHPGGVNYTLPAGTSDMTEQQIKGLSSWFTAVTEGNASDNNGGGLSLILSNALGLPVYLMNLAIGAQHALNAGPTGLYGTGGNGHLQTHYAFAGGAFDAILVSQGEAEFDSSASIWKSVWRDTNIPAWKAMNAQPGGTVIPVFFMLTGRNTGTPADPASNNANANIVRKAQQEIVSEIADAYMLGHHVGVAMADTVHFETLGANGYRELARRMGLTVAKTVAGTGWSGVGPVATGATRSGAVITVAVDLNGATGLSGTALTSWEVATSSDFSTGAQTINSAEVSGGNVVLTLASDPGQPVYVRNYAGYNPDVSSWAIGTYSDATTIPMMPVTAPLLSD